MQQNKMDEVLGAVEQLTSNFNAARQRLYDQLKPAFGEMFQEFLNRYPFVDNVSFTAYTPYFMDGDECIYSVNELEIEFVGASDADGEDVMAGFYGPKAEDFIAFRMDGTVTEDMKQHTEYYTTPRLRYQAYGSYSSEKRYDPALYDSVEAYLNAHYPAQMKMSYGQLRQMDQAEQDFGKLQSMMGSLDDDFIRGMFGDHVRVVINREGVETEEYSHD